MLSLSLVALGLAVIGAYASPTVRAPGGLEISLSTPADKVAFPSDLKVTATVKNTGNEDLKIFKFGSVLDDEHHTRSFIVSRGGKEIPFIGTEVVAFTDHLFENSSVVIPAGKDLTVEHDVSALYDFSASGPGAFTFDPVSKFKVIGADGITHTEIAKAHPVSITITDGVSKPEKRQQVDCADFKHSSAISGSAAGARALASAALSYLKSHGDDDKLYKSYFGSNAIENITSNFLTIVDEGTAPGALSCSDPFNICRDTPSVAYNSGQDIYYCNSFYSQLPLSSLCTGETTVSARNIRGGTTLRQLAGSLIFGMQSPGLSCSDSQQIPVREQIRTDDNYECFATQVYNNTMCGQVDNENLGGPSAVGV